MSGVAMMKGYLCISLRYSLCALHFLIEVNPSYLQYAHVTFITRIHLCFYREDRGVIHAMSTEDTILEDLSKLRTQYSKLFFGQTRGSI